MRAVLWDEVPVTLEGEFTMTVPADTMGFIVLRDELDQKRILIHPLDKIDLVLRLEPKLQHRALQYLLTL